TAEGEPFSMEEMHEMLELARIGITELFEIQRTALS
ncbi:MAG: ribonuclease PH, partial [Glaciecola sp.]